MIIQGGRLAPSAQARGAPPVPIDYDILFILLFSARLAGGLASSRSFCES